MSLGELECPQEGLWAQGPPYAGSKLRRLQCPAEAHAGVSGRLIAGSNLRRMQGPGRDAWKGQAETYAGPRVRSTKIQAENHAGTTIMLGWPRPWRGACRPETQNESARSKIHKSDIKKQVLAKEI